MHATATPGLCNVTPLLNAERDATTDPNPVSVTAFDLTPRSETNSPKEQRILHGFFVVKNYACFKFKNINLYFPKEKGFDVNEETVFCNIDLTDPNLDKPKWFRSQGYDECLEIATQCNILAIPVSLVERAIEGNPIQIKWEYRTLNLTFTEIGGISKSKVIKKIAGEIISREICDDEDAAFIQSNTYIPKKL